MPNWEGDELEAFLSLALVPGIGVVRLRALLASFETPSAVLAAPTALLARLAELGPGVADALAQADRGAGRRALAALAEVGGSVLTEEDEGFPALLRQIPDPPTHLFLLGDPALLGRPAVAIVGSRDHSAYGAEVCRALARAAAAAGLVVVSGMARGLDGVAHAGALEADGATIGVLGTGVDVVYPASNRPLFQQVVRQGLLLTEFPPGARPTEGSFPRRNRLISGLARVTVVVEAALKSGALQTAAFAQDQGREVLAVPGPITSAVSVGTNALIRDGATPLLELADVLDHYPSLVRTPASPSDGPDPPLEGRLLGALRIEPLHVEQLLERTGLPVREALQALSALELTGRVRLERSGYYRLVPNELFAAGNEKDLAGKSR